MIPEKFILEVKQKTNIYIIVSAYVDLKKVGKNWQGLCPFHKEKTPSFHVNEEKQVYKCFGCGKGGGVVDFIKEQERKTFPEAIYSLALEDEKKTASLTLQMLQHLLHQLNQRNAYYTFSK